MPYSTLSKPLLFDSQLKFRLELAKSRLNHYPLGSMNFMMMDLERPQLRTRHAHWCTYDLTGRTLLFYSLAEGIDGKHIEQLPELYERIMNNRRKSGMFGNSLNVHGDSPESAKVIGTHFLSGLVQYYSLTGDMRALRAAQEAADFLLAKEDEMHKALSSPHGPNKMDCWIVEGFAELYRETRNEKYLDAVRRITRTCVGQLERAHSHGYMTTLRGILKAAIYAQDAELAEFVRVRRQEILDRDCVTSNGDVSECFPTSFRNEGCSISDWIMLNLLYAYHFGDDRAYELAEHSLWNALYFNQFVTGGFGHRCFSKRGYRAYVEEAWWCCTQNAGMCLAELARHVVTVKEDRLKLNFFIPGRYTVPTANGEITVTVTTGYPTKAETIVKVTGTKEDPDIRVPGFIKGFTCRRVETPFGYDLYLDGRMGHYTEKHKRGTVVKYGPLVIAPMIYRWEGSEGSTESTTVPSGYTHDSIQGNGFSLVLGKPDEDGFYALQHDPLPDWSVFEEGEMAGIAGGEAATARIPVVLPDGKTRELLLQPLCSATSNLTLMDVVVDFDVEQ